LIVQPPVEEEIFEDEISEPEEDTLAGQMASMKKDQQSGKQKDNDSDFTTDSEDDDN
jgi:translocation protein SEC63